MWGPQSRTGSTLVSEGSTPLNNLSHHQKGRYPHSSLITEILTPTKLHPPPEITILTPPPPPSPLEPQQTLQDPPPLPRMFLCLLAFPRLGCTLGTSRDAVSPLTPARGLSVGGDTCPSRLPTVTSNSVLPFVEESPSSCRSPVSLRHVSYLSPTLLPPSVDLVVASLID